MINCAFSQRNSSTINLDLSWLASASTLFLGWNVNLEPFQKDAMDLHRRVKQIQNSGAELELVDRDNRLNSSLVWVGIIAGKDIQPFTRNAQSIRHRDVQCC
jgi:hypothetical protein